MEFLRQPVADLGGLYIQVDILPALKDGDSYCAQAAA